MASKEKLESSGYGFYANDTKYRQIVLKSIDAQALAEAIAWLQPALDEVVNPRG